MFREKGVWLVGAVRTAIGDFGGSLKAISPTQLAKIVIEEVVKRAGIDSSLVQHVVMGHVILTEPRDLYLSRYAAVEAGLPQESTALTINRLCGSGLHAISLAAQSILCGDGDVAVAGGAESMSRSGFLLQALRWGQRMGNVTAEDIMLAALHDPFQNIHMGVTAENLARRYCVNRQAQDAYSLESHRRASRAQQAGYFDTQIIPLMVKDPVTRQTKAFQVDEHVRRDLDLDSLAKLKPVFEKEGTVTAGNASSLNDGAAAVLLMSEEALKEHRAEPLARIVAVGHSGVDPSYMGIGPIPAVKQALARAGLTVQDMDVIESNEAFAVQSLCVAQDLMFDPSKTNPNGGAVASGHPIAATGAMLMVKTIYELQRVNGRYGMITMCIGGGQGIAMIIAR